MRNDIKMFVYRDSGHPHLIIRVRSLDGMNEQVVIDERDVMLCDGPGAKGILIRDAILELAEMTILPAEDLLRMSGTGENAQYIRDFVFPKPRIVREPKPEPPPETGWIGFLSGVSTAIMEAHKNYVLPKARVIKGGK